MSPIQMMQQITSGIQLLDHEVTGDDYLSARDISGYAVYHSLRNMMQKGNRDDVVKFIDNAEEVVLQGIIDDGFVDVEATCANMNLGKPASNRVAMEACVLLMVLMGHQHWVSRKYHSSFE